MSDREPEVTAERPTNQQIEDTMANNKTNQAQGEATEPTAQQQPSEVQTEVTIEQLQAEKERLEQEKEELRDQLLRRHAEFQNYRRRVEQERAELIEYAAMEVVRQLLPILDDFERALKAPCSDQEYVRGIELIYQRFFNTLSKLGLEPIQAQGQQFDPHIHHAVQRIPASEEHPEDTVVEELQRGYYFKGRLLRPALVSVAVKMVEAERQQESNQQN